MYSNDSNILFCRIVVISPPFLHSIRIKSGVYLYCTIPVIATTMEIPRIKRENVRMKEEKKDFLGIDYENMPFAMECFGISYCDESYYMERNCAHLTVIEYVISGTGTVESPKGTFRPSTGDAYLLRANEPHKYYADPKFPWVKIWVNLQGKLITPILDAYGLTHSMYLPKMDIYSFLKRIHDIASPDDIDIVDAMDDCCQVFLELCQYIRNNLNAGELEKPVPRNISLLKEYLDVHLEERLSLEKCSEITFLSISQTIRRFRSAYGVTPYEYLNQRRILTAKQLLQNSTLSIEEIATQTGFTDHNYFSKYFKKKVGVSPSRFRKESETL